MRWAIARILVLAPLALIPFKSIAQITGPLPDARLRPTEYCLANTKQSGGSASFATCMNEISVDWRRSQAGWHKITPTEAMDCTGVAQKFDSNPAKMYETLAGCVQDALARSPVGKSIGRGEFFEKELYESRPDSNGSAFRDNETLWVALSVLVAIIFEVVAWIAVKPPVRRLAVQTFFILLICTLATIPAGQFLPFSALATLTFIAGLSAALSGAHKISQTEPEWSGKEGNLALLGFLMALTAIYLLASFSLAGLMSMMPGFPG